MTERKRYVALRGKITPSARNRFGSVDFGGTVGSTAHGRAEEARDVADLDPASNPLGEHELASEVSERIRAIISSAEAAANAVRHEAEQRAQVKRRLAEDEARRIVEDSRRDAEAFLAERIRRISELSDAVVERGEGVVMRLERAEEVRRQLQGLADALGESAEELARELGAEEPASARSKARPPKLRPPTEPGERPASPAAEPAAEAAQVTDSPSESDSDAPSLEALDAEIADDPTIGGLAAEVAEDEDDDAPVVPVELVPDEPEPDRERRSASSREPDEQLSARLVALQMAVAGGKRDEVETHLRRTFDLGDVTQILDDVFGDDGDGGDKAGWPSRDGAA